MTTDSVFILFKKTDFNTILACLGVRCVGGGGHNIFLPKWGVAILLMPTFCEFGTPLQKKLIAPSKLALKICYIYCLYFNEVNGLLCTKML